MNIIDLIVALLIVVAIVDGARKGFVVQVCSLAGVVAGIWLGMRYGDSVGQWLGLDEQVVGAGGFITVLLCSLIVVMILAHLARKACRLIGLGVWDSILGAAVAVVKYILILSVLCAAFTKLNVNYILVSSQRLDASECYKLLTSLSEKIQPCYEHFGQWVSEEKQEIQEIKEKQE